MKKKRPCVLRPWKAARLRPSDLMVLTDQGAQHDLNPA
jgi:hypothetical protein